MQAPRRSSVTGLCRVGLSRGDVGNRTGGIDSGSGTHPANLQDCPHKFVLQVVERSCKLILASCVMRRESGDRRPRNARPGGPHDGLDTFETFVTLRHLLCAVAQKIGRS